MLEEKDNTHLQEPGHELRLEHEDSTIQFLHRVIRVAVKLIAIEIFINISMYLSTDVIPVRLLRSCSR